MDVVREDAELASELVVILGKELKAAKRQIDDLKTKLQVAQRGDVRKVEELERQVAEQQQQISETQVARKYDVKRVEELQMKLDEFGFQNRWLHTELNRVAGVKKEEGNDIALPPVPSFNGNPELLTKIGTLEGELAKAHQEAGDERKEKLVAIQKCDNLQAQVADLHQERMNLIADLQRLELKAEEPSSHAPAMQRTGGNLDFGEKTTGDNMSKTAVDVYEISSEDSEEENDNSDTLSQNLEESASLVMESEDDPSVSSLHTIHNPNFKRFITCLPVPKFRPQIAELTAICSSPKQLTPQLASDSIIRRYGSFLYFPRRTFWQGGQNTHAVVFGPLEVYNQSGLWIRSTEFSLLHGHVFPLFYGTTTVYYVGNYRCHHAHEWFPDGIASPKHISKQVLADLVLENAGPFGANSGIQSKSQLVAQYSQGLLKTDCLILQCVGFDRALYNQLLTRKKPSKRKRIPNYNPGPSKRQKKSKPGLGGAKQAIILEGIRAQQEKA